MKHIKNRMKALIMSVLLLAMSIAPQAMALTWMLLGASSLARALVKASTPPLEAEYATSVEAPTRPQTDEIFIILPDLRLSIIGITSLLQLNTEVKFTCIM